MKPMITKQTAYDIWIAYDEIDKSKKILADLEELLKKGEEMNLRDTFGRHRCLQLGVPSGESSHRLFDVHPGLAIEVIKAHIAKKQSELAVMDCRVALECSQ